MKIYISGAVTNTTDYAERFDRAEKELIEKGFTVINPVKVNAELPDDIEYEDYMRMCYCMLDMCDCIYMLDGWEKSNGAVREFTKSWDDNRPVMFESIGGMVNP